MERDLKTGDHLKCIKNRIYEGEKCFTKGKSYEIQHISSSCVYFTDDLGEYFSFGKRYLVEHFKRQTFLFGR